MIANRALELGGHRRGEYDQLSPLDDVNRSQSTNDTYPTALKVALCLALDRLLAELELLEHSFRDKGGEFAGVLKVGRTQLQDAVPMTLGQEFEGFAVTLGEDRAVLRDVMPMLWEINLGTSAVVTGIDVSSSYQCSAMAARTGEVRLDRLDEPRFVRCDALRSVLRARSRARRRWRALDALLLVRELLLGPKRYKDLLLGPSGDRHEPAPQPAEGTPARRPCSPEHPRAASGLHRLRAD